MSRLPKKHRIAINGYGRIGQSVLRALYVDPRHSELQVVAINELSDLDTLTYLTRYDTTHGRFPVAVANDGSHLLINGDRIRALNEQDPENLPWKELDVDLVLECTGTFTDRATAERHLASGARRLLFSQPADAEVDATIVHGFNSGDLQPGHRIVSSASCTTNCIVPILDLLERHYGIENGVTTTIHSAMNDQPVIDSYHHTDLRLTRSAMHSMVPVDTGLHQGIGKMMPALSGRFECLHLRVPTINVSLMDLAINLRRPTDAASVNTLFREAAAGPLQGLLGYTEEPHASVDFNTDPRSAIVDGTQTRVSVGRLLKLMAWFDNEWSYANRMLDVAQVWLNLAGE
ncbi:D-erythrose-4-phosphate dehydrogenase [Desulfuromonas versatilis]|uniref:D-erythrose-4-phosphate dehydrogenase n=1 Tax=Desulfuromonas versatilis TaxID=2802975 RepID=A0ABM8I3A8_9BACT|nr:glyceraldehyde 3-phosphate dehydrogenase NAD-binding domain-containing protein [Desulfuromonas versatilis]BCR07013.1 D-erythrose-4-phosphate dehydrogenase [Desulfuromonas versatilis]